LTLLDVNALLENGLEDRFDQEIVIEDDNHRLKNISYGAVQIESLISLLINIVLRDILIVDVKWYEEMDHFMHINHLIIPESFEHNDFGEIRNYALNQLAITESLKSLKDSKPSDEDSEKKYMALIFGGSAGYLARSSICKAPYVGHPLRERIIRKSSILNPRTPRNVDVTNYVLKELQSGRTKLFQRITPEGNSAYASFNLPPIIIELIRESNSAEDLIRNAVQMRDDFEGLRNWLKEYQLAIDDEDPRNLISKKKLLDSRAKSSAVFPGNTQLRTGNPSRVTARATTI